MMTMLSCRCITVTLHKRIREEYVFSLVYVGCRERCESVSSFYILRRAGFASVTAPC